MSSSGNTYYPACEARTDGYENCRKMYDRLSCYTLSHSDPDFIHQHALDAYFVQHASDNRKPLANAFAFCGLYLFVERGFNGRQVQRAHMSMARHKRDWLMFSIPENKSSLTVADALAAQAGRARDDMILAWAKSVWEIGSNQKGAIEKLLIEEKIFI